MYAKKRADDARQRNGKPADILRRARVEQELDKLARAG